MEATLLRFPSRRDELRAKLGAIDAETPTAEFAGHGKLPKIDGYEKLSEIDRGGFGVVYKARQQGLDHWVAIKMLLAEARRNEKAVTRFAVEARAISLLTHDHIVRILHIGRHEGALYLVLEYLEGGTLARRIAGKPLTSSDAGKITERLADALEQAHELGVLHRDLKPSNVLFDKEGRPKLTDFGLARLGDGDQTRTLDIVGTPNYMPPEQASGNVRELSGKADIYSLGAVLYEMLTGRPPFVGPTPAIVINKVLGDLPESIKKLNPAAAPELVLICEKCLEKNPQDRFASAAALRDELARYRKQEPLLIFPLSRPQRLLKWAKRKPALATLYALAILAVGLTGLTLGVGWLWRAAESARGQLAIARDEADHLKIVAEEQSHRRYQLQHLAAAKLLPRVWNEGSYFEMPALLEELTPIPGFADLRGFEWRYWKRIADDLRLIEAHSDFVFALAVSPREPLIATGCQDGSLRLWNYRQAKRLYDLLGHKRPITGIAFSPDGKRLASIACSVDQPNLSGEIKIWNTATGALVVSQDLPMQQLYCVSFTPSGKQLVTGGVQSSLLAVAGTLRVWNPDTLKQVQELFVPRQRIEGIGFSPDGKKMATGSDISPNQPGELILWNTDTWREERKVGRHPKGVWSVMFTSDGKHLVSTEVDASVRVWNVANGGEVAVFKENDLPVRRIDLSPDGKTIATASLDGTLKLIDIETKKTFAQLRGHAGSVNDVKFSPDGTQLISVGTDGTARV